MQSSGFAVMRENIPPPLDLVRPSGTEQPHATNQGVFPRFFYKEQEFPKNSKQFIDRLLVELHIPGDRGNKPVLRMDRLENGKPVLIPERAQQWAAELQSFFTARRENKVNGTPLDTWGRLTPAAVATLTHHFGVWTVEALANLPDVAKQELGLGADGWVKDAQAFVASRASSTQLAAENAELKARLERLEAMARADASAPDASVRVTAPSPDYEVPTKRPPGRPRKAEAA